MPGKRKTPPLSEREKLIRDSNPAILNRILDVHRKRFEHSGNPLSAWDAFLLARWWKEPIPEWVLAYFEEAAEKLCKIPQGKIPGHVMAALGINSKGRSSFARYTHELTRWRVVRRAAQLHEAKPSRALEQIYMTVAEEFHDKGIILNIRTIEEWFRELHEVVRET